MKYEYKVITDHELMREDKLNEFGNKGWELVTVIPGTNNMSRYFEYFFKREVK